MSILQKVVTKPRLIISQPPEDLEWDLSVRGKPLSIMSHRGWCPGKRKLRQFNFVGRRLDSRDFLGVQEEYARRLPIAV